MKDQINCVIEHNKPIPPSRQTGRLQKYPYRDMQVGDSIFCATGVSTHVWELKTGYKFTKRNVTENGIKGSRVWRIADA